MSNKMALDALKFAEAALADIGDADREPGDDLAWCEARAAEALPQTRAAIAALQPQPEHERNATRLAFMQKQMLAADFDYDGECVLVFQWPRSAPVGADLIRNIDAAAALQAEPQGWRPIETAPKDAHALLWIDIAIGQPLVVQGCWFHDDDADEKGWIDLDGNVLNATHWMPLPAHPKD